MSFDPDELPTRFREKFDVLASGCWEWTAYRLQGYGRFAFGGRSHAVYAHRFAYEALAGPIPDGLVIDHLCRNRACVNPEHLEPVTNRENLVRGQGLIGINVAKTHCLHGHEFTPENTRRNKEGHRECKTCSRARLRELRRRQRSAA